jgi:hypothetical protein
MFSGRNWSLCCCQGGQLPGNFPPWKTVHEQFRIWRDNGVWERVGKMLRDQGRKAKGRNATPTVAILDSQSAKTALKGGSAATTPARKSKAANVHSAGIQDRQTQRPERLPSLAETLDRRAHLRVAQLVQKALQRL